LTVKASWSVAIDSAMIHYCNGQSQVKLHKSFAD
jgi:hypothetical protein